MKVRVDSFKGLMPKLSNRALPNNNATVAHNCRLLSNDIQPWNDGTDYLTLGKTAPISAIYPIDVNGVSGGPFWQSFSTSESCPDYQYVTMTKGAVITDPNETTFFTGAADVPGISSVNDTQFRPKVTNIPLATTTPVQSPEYPYDWRLLGVPAPATTLVATSTYTGGSYTTLVDGTSLTNTTSILVGDGTNTVTLSTAVGDPTSSVLLTMTDNSTLTIQGAGFAVESSGLAGYGTYSVDFYIDSSSPGTPYEQSIQFTIGGDVNGNGGVGVLIEAYLTGTGNIKILSNATSPVGGNALVSQSISNLSTNTWYNITLQYNIHDTASNTVDATAILKQSGTPLATISIPNGHQPIIPSISPQYVSIISSALKNSSGNTWKTYIGNLQSNVLIVVDNPNYEATSYVQTWYTDLGYEGPPGGASDIIWIGPSLTTVVTGFDNSPPSGYGVIGSRLYRAVTGASTTAFQYNTQFPNLTTTTYTDTLTDSELGETLATENYDLPPTDGRFITVLANGIALIASKNTICPSVQYVLYAYPDEYQIGVDYNVVNMASLETQAVVLTTDAAYLCIGTDPSAMTLSKLTPIYGCASSESAVKWNLSGTIWTAGVVYSANDGLVLTNSYGSQLISREYISPKEWQANYYPSTIQAQIYQDMYVGIYNDGTGQKAFIFDPRENGLGFVDVDINADATYCDHSAETLYYVVGQIINTWNTGGPLTYTWRSKVFQLPYPANFTSAQVRGVTADSQSNVTMNLYSDESVSPFYSTTITSNKEFVLPSQVSYDIQVELTGTGQVSTVEIAEVMEELM